MSEPVRAGTTPALKARVDLALAAALEAHPHQRVCQVIVNATGQSDPFYVEDETLIEGLNEYALGGGGKSRADAIREPWKIVVCEEHDKHCVWKMDIGWLHQGTTEHCASERNVVEVVKAASPGPGEPSIEAMEAFLCAWMEDDPDAGMTANRVGRLLRALGAPPGPVRVTEEDS